MIMLCIYISSYIYIHYQSINRISIIFDYFHNNIVNIILIIIYICSMASIYTYTYINVFRYV